VGGTWLRLGVRSGLGLVEDPIPETVARRYPTEVREVPGGLQHMPIMNTKEHIRLKESLDQNSAWKKWGPYLSERQWGTVREDYSDTGNAWDYFTHEQARSRAYRWGEDGLAGFSDEKQRLCFALALWNGRDPILKERLFGLTNSEGNHGEDVKEYYFYLDSTPTHSYMKYLYKYPQSAFPYFDLVKVNRERSRFDFEYELLDTGVFDQDRYFDVFVEYAKQAPEDILIQITVANRGPETATLHVLPTLWFRNTWAGSTAGEPKPVLRKEADAKGASVIAASHPQLGDRLLYCEGQPALLFTENETNEQRLFGRPNPVPFVKDAFHECVVQGRKEAVNPAQAGTKAAAHYVLSVAPGAAQVVRLRLAEARSHSGAKASTAKTANLLGEGYSRTMKGRQEEADEFYKAITPPSVGEEAARVMRQALAGMLWTKQYYGFDVDKWLAQHEARPLVPRSRNVRNKQWFHMVNDDIISMPDKWEYPWYAAWDLAFHTMALSMVDVDFAKEQLALVLKDAYQHPSGQVPAYEWNFSDVNPPVHAWATLFLYNIEKQLRGKGDVDFLKRVFNRLALNFTWWVNRKDRFGKNVFEGGFLGLDNIGVFDRSAPLPTGGHLEQADGTAWMALFCQNMGEIAVELATVDPTYEDLAIKFVEHFFWIAAAVNQVGGDGLWDEEDGFYYDLLRLPDGRSSHLKVRSMVGLLPICATTVIEKYQREQVPRVVETIYQRLRRMPELRDSVHAMGPGHFGVAERGIAALVNEHRLRRILARMLDENEFFSPYGIRALSRCHAERPYVFWAEGQEYRVDYLPAESNTGMFGGNSNWRGPIWFPVNALLIRALLQYYAYYGDRFQVECPTGSGRRMNLFEVSRELGDRLTRIFLPDERGRRPVYGGTKKFQTDPHWRDCILFYEYFHGDNGAGLGASHQTGWTGLVARLIQLYGHLEAETFLKAGKRVGVQYLHAEEAKREEEPADLTLA
jgi:Mannosylglycerate hydrolase MGH1-like glycoside hydrolase domain/Glycosyl hydrolase family 63 C-terminal domain